MQSTLFFFFSYVSNTEQQQEACLIKCTNSQTINHNTLQNNATVSVIIKGSMQLISIDSQP